jgi:hypothetical protein
LKEKLIEESGDTKTTRIMERLKKNAEVTPANQGLQIARLKAVRAAKIHAMGCYVC